MGLFSKLSSKDVFRMEDRKDIDGLIKALSNKDFGVRYQAVFSLRELKDPRSFRHLYNFLPDGEIGFDAASALGKMDNDDALDLLCEALTENVNPGLNLWIAENLISNAYNKAVEPIVQYLSNCDREVHQAIFDIFSRFSHSEDWENIKNIFTPVYKMVTDNLGMPTDKKPIETIYEGDDIDEVMKIIQNEAIPYIPILDESQINSEYSSIRDKWGTPIQRGGIEELLSALRPRLKSDKFEREFIEFSIQLYFTQNCAQVNSHFGGRFKGHRIWCSDKDVFFCFSSK